MPNFKSRIARGGNRTPSLPSHIFPVNTAALKLVWILDKDNPREPEINPTHLSNRTGFRQRVEVRFQPPCPTTPKNPVTFLQLAGQCPALPRRGQGCHEVSPGPSDLPAFLTSTERSASVTSVCLFKTLAKLAPNLIHHRRIASWLTVMPRSASRSSMNGPAHRRWLRLKR
jgi:hypothetical protein